MIESKRTMLDKQPGCLREECGIHLSLGYRRALSQETACLLDVEMACFPDLELLCNERQILIEI